MSMSFRYYREEYEKIVAENKAARVKEALVEIREITGTQKDRLKNYYDSQGRAIREALANAYIRSMDLLVSKQKLILVLTCCYQLRTNNENTLNLHDKI